MHPIGTSEVAFDDLASFFKQFDFTSDTSNIQQYVSLIQEVGFLRHNIIHELYDLANDEVIGFTALSISNEVDDLPGVLVEFLYLKSKYRGKVDEFSNEKYSSIFLDYIIKLALDIQKKVAINHVYLVPINEKVRKIYENYGFENLPSSGSNEYEDYMVFNLLEDTFL